MRSGDRGDRQEFDGEVAVGNGIDRVAGRFAEAECGGSHVPVDRIAGAGECCSADRRFVQVLDGMAHARAIAAEHFDICHAVMAEGYRLGGLEVREARHDRVGVLLGAIEESGDEAGQCRFRPGKLFLHPEAEVERDLVVARTGGVQPAGGRTDQRRQPRLDVHVNVFELARELEIAALDL